MATIKHALLGLLRGSIGKELVFKQYGNKTVVSKYPKKSCIKSTQPQQLQRKRFAEAAAYAKAINRDPVQRAIYEKKVKQGQSVYHYALKEYLDKQSGT